MKLNYEGLKARKEWEKAGVALPKFDWKQMCEETEKTPVWLHFGAGNIFHDGQFKARWKYGQKSNCIDCKRPAGRQQRCFPVERAEENFCQPFPADGKLYHYRKGI